MKVKYATQVFSNSVAVGMNLYIRFGVLPPEAKATEEFIRKVNYLFDILNSSKLESLTVYQQPYRGDDEQREYLLDCYEMFKNLQVLDWKGDDVTKTIKCVKGWQVTINGMINLWDVLKTNYEELQFLYTRNVNQDCLENFFGCLRQQGGNCVNPTSIQFIRSFRRYFCIDMLHSGTENCERDNTEMLINVLDMMNTENINEKLSTTNAMSPVTTDYRNSEVLKKNFTRYICGYLIKKCLSIHTCDVCEKYAREYQEVDETSLYCFLKAYQYTESNLFGNLYMPHNDFIQFVTSMEILFQENFEMFSVSNNIVQKFVNVFRTLQYNHPCSDFPYEYVNRLYSRIRLFYTLKKINLNFKTPNRNRKLIVWKNE
nr:unnamed protein product [Callosobruchus analis]